MTGGVYIGQTKQSLQARFAHHLKKPPPLMANDLAVHGPELFQISPFATTTNSKEANAWERAAIVEEQTAAAHHPHLKSYNTIIGPPQQDRRFLYLKRTSATCTGRLAAAGRAARAASPLQCFLPAPPPHAAAASSASGPSNSPSPVQEPSPPRPQLQPVPDIIDLTADSPPCLTSCTPCKP
jgi:hypothetical protein